MAVDTRTRNFATIVYEESAPEGWLDILDSYHIPAFVSPLHSRDLKEDNSGEFKKPHWHVLIMFAGKKSPDSVKELTESFGGVGLEKVQTLKAYARYLCHLDDDDKAQYNPEEVLCFGGSDYRRYLTKDIEKDVVIGEIVDYILENEGVTFAHVVKYARYNKPEWFKALVATGSAYLIRGFIESIRENHGYTGLYDGFKPNTEGINSEFAEMETMRKVEERVKGVNQHE